MSDFLQRARAIHKKEAGGGQYGQDFARVFAAIGKLQQVNSKSALDVHNLEEVFGAFEMARMIRTFPGVPEAEVDGLLDSFKRMIVHTLEQEIQFPINTGHGLSPTSTYAQFAELIRKLNSNAARPRCSIITFNYDVALDYALRCAGVQIDYGFEAISGGTPTLKLHGSLNWGKVQGEDAIVAWDLLKFTMNKHWPRELSRKGVLGVGSAIISGRSRIQDKAVEPVPVIIPPTWNKTTYYQAIAPAWKRAARELATAEYVFVSGYSLTGTDTYFKYLFSLGSTSDCVLQKFAIFDPGPVKEKFEQLLGHSARSVFRCHQTDFKSLVDTLRDLVPKHAGA